MVIAVHTAQAFTRISMPVHFLAHYGQMGVQLFFVASAYTLCHSWIRRQSERNHLAKFYLRRFFRIAPLYYFAILIYFSVHQIDQALQGAQSYTAINIAANILFIHGFYPPAHDSIVPGGWSIGTEMAFYLIFPALIAVFQRLNLRSYIAWGIVALSIIPSLLNFALLRHVSISLTTMGGSFNNTFAYHELFTQMPVFLIGIVAFYQHQRNDQSHSQYHRLSQFAFFLLFTTITLILAWYEGRYSFVIIPISSGISFYFLMNIFRNVAKPGKILMSIGKASYSMYDVSFSILVVFTQVYCPAYS